MKYIILTLTTLALTACATVKTNVIQTIPKNTPVAVIPDRELDDWHIQTLLISALQERGIRAVDGRNLKENPPTTVLRYNDYWFWD